MEHVWAHRPCILGKNDEGLTPCVWEILYGGGTGPLRVKTPCYMQGEIKIVDRKYAEAIIAHNRSEDRLWEEQLHPCRTDDLLEHLLKRQKETDAALPEELRGHNG